MKEESIYASHPIGLEQVVDVRGTGSSPPTKEGGLQSRMQSQKSMLHQLHEEISMLEAELTPLLNTQVATGACAPTEKRSAGSLASTAAGELSALAGAACERIRGLRLALDL